MTYGLSKSRITLFEQCPKRLWLTVHRPDLGDDTADVRRGFAVGHAVGDLACAAYPDGIMIGGSTGMAAALTQTRHLLDAARTLRTDDRRPLFEATFAHDGVLVRADLLLPHGDGWHLAEVKSTASVKDYHLGDLATQVWVASKAGVVLTAASIRHLDTRFVLPRSGDYAGLFVDAHLLDAVAPIVATRPAVVTAARRMLSEDMPSLAMGDHCDTPFTCSFKVYCGRDRAPAPTWPTTLLPDAAGKKLARAWAARGIDDLCAIPADMMPTVKLARIRAATVDDSPWHDRDAIVAETADWAWPRTWLDFETIASSVPRWPGTRPYQQVPFQFSAHMTTADGDVTHAEHLSTDGCDPRRGCAEALAQLPTTGAVVAWNASFERAVLLGLAARFADLAAALSSLADRLVDLLPIVRRHYYHRAMRGSWSIKAVLPTLAPELAHVQLAIASGTDAQAGYLEAIDPATAPARHAEIRDALVAYCRRDTEAMIIVLERLTADGRVDAKRKA